MDMITLNTKEQLNIYMNPQRQKLMRILGRSAAPRTPKDLSLELGVSASSIQHHLKKLASLGLVHVDHTAKIRGITARYYAATRVTVRIGGEDGASLSNEREALLRSLVADVLDGTLAQLFRAEPHRRAGDVLTGIVHLTPERAKELEEIIRDFVQKNEVPCKHSQPWEYALMYCRMD